MSDLNIPFKPGAVGRMPSKALFEDGTYSIEEFHDVFLNEEDPTEYKPAIKLCGSWREWQRLKRDWPQFNGYIQEWKDELEIKLESRALQKIQELSKGDDNKALTAAKFIAETKRRKVGRPSKAEKDRAVKEIARAAAETKDEESRILKLMSGGKV